MSSRQTSSRVRCSHANSRPQATVSGGSVTSAKRASFTPSSSATGRDSDFSGCGMKVACASAACKPAALSVAKAIALSPRGLPDSSGRSAAFCAGTPISSR